MNAQTTRHGIRVITGKNFMFSEPPVRKLVTREIPGDLIARRFSIAKTWHYPTEILYRLQEEKCFFCGEQMDPVKYRPSQPNGYRKCQFYPRSRGYAMWGNKVVGHAACALKHEGAEPTEAQEVKFRKLYSVGRFETVFPEEAQALAKGGA